ncbi:MAG: hypothetical protein NTU61_01995 [Candidatus Altiarchaeota archaeon]|nr:hypothetical protein [Candidatus Altiarchaeota archaeon]
MESKKIIMLLAALVVLASAAWFIQTNWQATTTSTTTLTTITTTTATTTPTTLSTVNPETYCETDSDCACGVHKTTGDCFLGNSKYVDVVRQCPDFCNGFAGDRDVGCVNNTCMSVKASP